MAENTIASDPALEIFLLGRFRVKIDGVPVDEKLWGRRSAKSLIKLLALKPFHTLHKEQIMDLLWTEQLPESALNNLNKAIYGARRALEPNLPKGAQSRFIRTQTNQIILESPGTLHIDLDEFQRLANYALQNNNLKAGQKALELYRGDLLTEDIYEDWIYSRRESIRILFRKTATKVAELQAAQGDRAASIEILKKLVVEDSSDELCHRRLMRLYAETGSKYLALRQFESCCVALRNLGVEPEPETIILEQSIKRGGIIAVKNDAKPAPAVSTPRITQLTFQNGQINSARFAPNGETIVFSADWNGGVAELFAMDLETGDLRSTGTTNARVLSISAAGEIAAALDPKAEGYLSRATLIKSSLEGGKPSPQLNEIQWAEWHPSRTDESLIGDEQYLAVVRGENGRIRLEYPIGNVIYETHGWLGRPRFSPDGERIAIVEHPLFGDDRGFVVCFDLGNGSKPDRQILTESMLSVQGLAWFDHEIWFTGAHEGSARTINAVNTRGEERLVYRTTGRLTLHDISRNGKVLVTDDKMRVQVAVRNEGEKSERDLTWHDWTLPRDISDDGTTFLFEEAGFSGGNRLAAYVRNTDGTATKKIADSSAISLSPDGKHALLRFHVPHAHLALAPIEGGEIKSLETDPANPLDHQVFCSFFSNGERIMFAANDSDGNTHIYHQEINGGKPVRFLPSEKGVKMLSGNVISPNDEFAVLTNAENRLALFRISDGTSSALKNLEDDFYLIRWAGDGESLFIWRRGAVPAIVYKYDLATGKKEKWLELMPKDSRGVYQIGGIKLTPSGKTCIYSYSREFSELYLMEDLM